MHAGDAFSACQPATSNSVSSDEMFVPTSEPRRAASHGGLPGKQVEIDPVAALEEQLRAVTLRVPPTPPTTPHRRDRRIGLVYDVCMELHQGPDGAPLPSGRYTRAPCCAMESSALTPYGSPQGGCTMPARCSIDDVQPLARPCDAAVRCLQRVGVRERARGGGRLSGRRACPSPRARGAPGAHGGAVQAHHRGGARRPLLEPPRPQGAQPARADGQSGLRPPPGPRAELLQGRARLPDGTGAPPAVGCSPTRGAVPRRPRMRSSWRRTARITSLLWTGDMILRRGPPSGTSTTPLAPPMPPAWLPGPPWRCGPGAAQCPRMPTADLMYLFCGAWQSLELV